LAALGFGIAAAHSGHWPRLFFFHLGEAAFAISFLLTVSFRIPLLRRARRGNIRPDRFARLTLALAVVELTVLFLAVADMVAKPTSSDTAALATGSAILASAVLASIAVGLSGRSHSTLDLIEIRIDHTAHDAQPRSTRASPASSRRRSSQGHVTSWRSFGSTRSRCRLTDPNTNELKTQPNAASDP
jgi:hypothetical protein